SDAPQLTPNEHALLAEYRTLADNLAQLATEITRLAAVPAAEITTNLRTLERKTALVSTLLKASVYSIFLEQQAHEDERH
ncbi:DASH complex subunit Dad3, partial [Dipodascopsis tothii]|uniref:DASH complex subunit Dad3 n=1 Tax=Dipodascopsis tothii TaxID=44089 RepID=UPI0034CF03C9